MGEEAALERQWQLPAVALRGALFALVAVFGWASVGLAEAATWCGILALAALPGVVLPGTGCSRPPGASRRSRWSSSGRSPPAACPRGCSRT
nr:hypothetical protein GCM10025732_22340 [Glycomyces mayteni]